MVDIVNPGYLNPAEVMTHVFKRHPEKTSIVFVAALLLDVICPKIRLIAPVSLPFEIAPRIPELNESDFVTEDICHFNSLEQSIGMLGN